MWKTIQKRFNSPDAYVSLILGLAVILMLGSLIVNYAKQKSPSSAKENGDAKSEAEQQAATSLPATHMVVAGETLWSIAETYFKNGYTWKEIATANNLADANSIEVGQTLTIPSVTPVALPNAEPGIVTSGESTGEAPTAKSYTVVSGDYLSNIALALYGDASMWTKIAEANNLVNPDIIHKGNVLTLP